MHHPRDRITHITAFVTPVVGHWLEREIAQWVHSMKVRSDDPSHYEQTFLPRSYFSLPVPQGFNIIYCSVLTNSYLILHPPKTCFVFIFILFYFSKQKYLCVKTKQFIRKLIIKRQKQNQNPTHHHKHLVNHIRFRIIYN